MSSSPIAKRTRLAIRHKTERTHQVRQTVLDITPLFVDLIATYIPDDQRGLMESCHRFRPSSPFQKMVLERIPNMKFRGFTPRQQCTLLRILHVISKTSVRYMEQIKKYKSPEHSRMYQCIWEYEYTPQQDARWIQSKHDMFYGPMQQAIRNEWYQLLPGIFSIWGDPTKLTRLKAIATMVYAMQHISLNESSSTAQVLKKHLYPIIAKKDKPIDIVNAFMKNLSVRIPVEHDCSIQKFSCIRWFLYLANEIKRIYSATLPIAEQQTFPLFGLRWPEWEDVGYSYARHCHHLKCKCVFQGISNLNPSNVAWIRFYKSVGEGFAAVSDHHSALVQWIKWIQQENPFVIGHEYKQNLLQSALKSTDGRNLGILLQHNILDVRSTNNNAIEMCLKSVGMHESVNHYQSKADQLSTLFVYGAKIGSYHYPLIDLAFCKGSSAVFAVYMEQFIRERDSVQQECNENKTGLPSHWHLDAAKYLKSVMMGKHGIHCMCNYDRDIDFSVDFANVLWKYMVDAKTQEHYASLPIQRGDEKQCIQWDQLRFWKPWPMCRKIIERLVQRPGWQLKWLHERGLLKCMPQEAWETIPWITFDTKVIPLFVKMGMNIHELTINSHFKDDHRPDVTAIGHHISKDRPDMAFCLIRHGADPRCDANAVFMAVVHEFYVLALYLIHRDAPLPRKHMVLFHLMQSGQSELIDCLASDTACAPYLDLCRDNEETIHCIQMLESSRIHSTSAQNMIHVLHKHRHHIANLDHLLSVAVR